MKLRNGDTVVVTSGKDRGRTGKVVRALPAEGRVIVEGINLHKKHARPKKQNEQGQIVEVAAPLPASNVKLVCPSCKTGTKIEYTEDEDGKQRTCKQCGSII